MVSEDDRYLVISIQRGTNPEARRSRCSIWQSPILAIRTLVAGFDTKAEVIGNVGSTFFLRTDLDADLGRVVAIDASIRTGHGGRRSCQRERTPS